MLTDMVADHVYLVCEPPGEPYYIGRIMEFLHVGNNPANPVDALRINWLYRPKDIGRRAQDTRLLYATMHSDISPLAALRGKCEIRHRSEIDNLDEYRKTPDCFWYEKLYDRYIQKNYDLIPTSAIINVPERVKKVLDERWKFVLVEQGRGKELTSAMKLCKKCGAYCARFVSILFCSFFCLFNPFRCSPSALGTKYFGEPETSHDSPPLCHLGDSVANAAYGWLRPSRGPTFRPVPGFPSKPP